MGDLEKKIKLYESVQKAIVRLAAGEPIQLGTNLGGISKDRVLGRNDLNPKEVKLFNALTGEHIPKEERIAMPLPYGSFFFGQPRDMRKLGYDENPWAAARELRKPRFRKDGEY